MKAWLRFWEGWRIEAVIEPSGAFWGVREGDISAAEMLEAFEAYVRSSRYRTESS